MQTENMADAIRQHRNAWINQRRTDAEARVERVRKSLKAKIEAVTPGMVKHNLNHSVVTIHFTKKEIESEFGSGYVMPVEAIREYLKNCGFDMVTYTFQQSGDAMIDLYVNHEVLSDVRD